MGIDEEHCPIHKGTELEWLCPKCEDEGVDIALATARREERGRCANYLDDEGLPLAADYIRAMEEEK